MPDVIGIDPGLRSARGAMRATWDAPEIEVVSQPNEGSGSQQPEPLEMGEPNANDGGEV